MDMFDLNVDFVNGEPTFEMEMEKHPESSLIKMEHSGSSKSSVVNSEEAEDLSNNSSAFAFDILKKETNGLGVKEESSTPEIVTRMLFPVTGDGGGRDSDPGLGLSARSQWLNLSFSEHGEQAEMRILQQKQPQVRKSRRGPRSRSSQYRGVTFYRRTGRWESHIWDCGKQVYLGGFDTAHAAARAYDRAAIKFRGVDADINFNLSDYDEDMKQMTSLSKEDFVHALRRQSSGVSRGNSRCRSAALQKCSQWEARTRQFLGMKVYENLPTNGREGLTSCDPITQGGETIVESSKGGSCHNLDLSLGISPTSKISAKGGPMADNSGPALNINRGQAIYGLPMAPKLDRIFTGLYSCYVKNYEGKEPEKRMEAVPLQRFSNLAWQVQSNGSIVPVPVPVPSNAASSGFASSNNLSSLTPLSINPQ
ncbi:hypothetical protein L6164_005580 [Bauhinia variegata]|uniref:Uncharacterized protein n=1 Tax=Bauhinia variegata TaxID=167791 RepID=A0ACB9PRR1_BAUVA|nr:hypothetical protein L6164_005580 [Bauhinia variegata]